MNRTEFWAKLVNPVIDVTPGRAEERLQLGLTKPIISQRVAYHPTLTEELLDRMMEPHDITLTYFQPVYLFPKQGMGGFVRGRIKTRGYLSGFEQVGSEASSGIEFIDCKLEILDVLGVSR